MISYILLFTLRFLYIGNTWYSLDVTLRLFFVYEMWRYFLHYILFFLYHCWFVSIVFCRSVIKIYKIYNLNSDRFIKGVIYNMASYTDWSTDAIFFSFRFLYFDFFRSVIFGLIFNSRSFFWVMFCIFSLIFIFFYFLNHNLISKLGLLRFSLEIILTF